MNLDGQVALITGAAGAGIGQATARALAGDGADVIITDIHERRTREAAAALSDELDREVLGLVVDVTDETAVNAAVAQILEDKRRIDLVVNNVARNAPAPIWEMTTETWHAIVDACLTSQFLVMRAALPGMIERRSGCVINVASAAAWLPSKWGDSAYAAAKAGVMALTRTAAAEVGEYGIRVNAVSPDLIWNEHLARMYPEDYFEEQRRKSPTGRLGKPADIARIIRFLATDDYLTGQVITSGGSYMHA